MLYEKFDRLDAEVLRVPVGHPEAKSHAYGLDYQESEVPGDETRRVRLQVKSRKDTRLDKDMDEDKDKDKTRQDKTRQNKDKTKARPFHFCPLGSFHNNRCEKIK
jgi:hypothetical protein